MIAQNDETCSEIAALVNRAASNPVDAEVCEEFLHSFDRTISSKCLISLTDAESADVRWFAIYFLIKVHPVDSRSAVLKLLSDDDTAIRGSLCKCIAELMPEPSFVDRLCELLLFDLSADVRSQAAYALGCIGDSRAESSLQRAASEDFAQNFEGTFVADHARSALAMIRS